MNLEEISIVVTIASTIATVAMVYFTYKMANSTKESVEEMKKTRVEANSAEVIMYFDVQNERMYLIVENIGNTIAKDISIEIDPELKDSDNEKYEHLKEISFLPPNYQIKTFFDMKFHYFNEYGDLPKFRFTITFTNIYNNRIKREYISDLTYLKSVSYLMSESDSIEMSLTKINKEFKKTNSYLKKLN